MVKNLGRSRYGLASAHVVFPLPTEVRNPVPIGITEWRVKSDDVRAPRRSVAAVRVIGRLFIAVVIDTVEGLERWLIVGPVNRLGTLYEGMQVGDGERHTLVISLPLRGPFERLPDVVQALEDAGRLGSDDECESPIAVRDVHGGYPTGGSPGLVVTASVASDVITGLLDAPETTLGNGDALDVPL
jgi:hypothetical protein